MTYPRQLEDQVRRRVREAAGSAPGPAPQLRGRGHLAKLMRGLSPGYRGGHETRPDRPLIA
jgi:hypothetical protein